MAPTTIMIFGKRQPGVNPTEFRNYIENKHVPYVRSLLGKDYSLSQTRYYINKDTQISTGPESAVDADVVSVIVYESQEAREAHARARQADEVRELIETHEAKVLDRSKSRSIILGEQDIARFVNHEKA